MTARSRAKGNLEEEDDEEEEDEEKERDLSRCERCTVEVAFIFSLFKGFVVYFCMALFCSIAWYWYFKMWSVCKETGNMQFCYENNSSQPLFPFYWNEPEHKEGGSLQLPLLSAHHISYIVGLMVLLRMTKAICYYVVWWPFNAIYRLYSRASRKNLRSVRLSRRRLH